MNDWKETILGDLLKIGRGSSPRPIKDFIVEKNGIPWVKIADATASTTKFIEKTKEFIKEEGRSTTVFPGDLIVSNSATPGIPKIMNIEACVHDGWLVFDNYDLIEKFFLYYFFLDYRIRLNRSASGTVFKNLTTEIVRNVPINLPPLPEQKAIANVLTAFDDKIELLQQQNTTLETIAQTIFKEWFGKYQIGYELPEGWQVGMLGKMAKHIKQNIKPFENPDKFYCHFSLPAYDNGLKPVIECGIEIRSNKYAIFENSFLVSKLNPFTPRIWTIIDSVDNNICSTEFQVVKPKKESSFSLIHCFLNSEYFTSELSQRVQGTSSSHQRVKPQDIFDVELVIPNEKDLLKFNSLIYPLISKKDVNHKQIQSLSKTRDALLPKLMSGQVRVKM